MGFWHGAEWKYVAYGVWNGVFIMSGILLENVYAKSRERLRIKDESAAWRIFRILRTFVIVSFGRFFSGGKSLHAALTMFRRTFIRFCDLSFLTDGTRTKIGLTVKNSVILLIMVALLFAVDLLHERKVEIRAGIARRNLAIRWVIYIGAVLAVLIFGMYGPEYDAASFIYEQF